MTWKIAIFKVECFHHRHRLIRDHMIFFFALCTCNIDFDYIDSLECGLAGLRSPDYHFTCSKAINNSKREELGWTKCIYDVNNKFMSDAFSVHTLITKHLLGFSSDTHAHILAHLDESFSLSLSLSLILYACVCFFSVVVSVRKACICFTFMPCIMMFTY